MQGTFLKVLTVVALAGGLAGATTISGSMTLNTTGATATGGTDLSNDTTLNWSTLSVAGTVGDYTVVPTSTTASPDGSPLDLGDLSAFTFTLGLYGTFDASGGVGSTIVSRSANFLDVYIDGTFTPGPDVATCAGPPSGSCQATDTSVRFAISQSGGNAGSTGITATLNSPAIPPSAPEPATMALLGSALIVVGLAGRKRLRR